MQFELLDTLDKRVQQSWMAKWFLTSDFSQSGTGLFGITILAAQFPQVYSPKMPILISSKFLIKDPNLCHIFVERVFYMNFCPMIYEIVWRKNNYC